MKPFKYSDQQINDIQSLAMRTARGHHLIMSGLSKSVLNGMIRVRLHKAKESDKWAKPPVAHWNPDWLTAEAKRTGMPKQVLWPYLEWDRIQRHLQKGENHMVGYVPAFIGCVMLDIDDYGNDDALLQVIDRYGQPLVSHPSGSGGWHLLYPVKTWDDALAFKDTSVYLVDGKAMGETACTSRWACMWSPRSLLKALDARINAQATGKANWMSEDRLDRPPLAPKPIYKEAKPLEDGAGITARQIIDHWGLTPRPNHSNQWEGGCPVCLRDTGDAGSTRFVLTLWGEMDSTEFGVICFAGSDLSNHGSRRFTDDEWLSIIFPILSPDVSEEDRAMADDFLRLIRHRGT